MSRGPGNQSVRPRSTDSSRTKVDRPPPPASADAAGVLVPGTVVAGRYRVVSVLGRGGAGQVYRADDLKLEQPVALKFLPEAIEANPYRRERFLDEVRLARRVTHPNICRIYDVVEDGRLTFISMEYIDGEDLATLLKRVGRLPPDRAAVIGLDLCAGLEAIHERGILHRDLKPANLMVDGEGRARITDFGMAGRTGSRPHGGTPRYMAPEQLMNLEVTPRSDLYALGLVLYELFTGERPFDRPRLAALAEPPTPPSRRVKDLDPAVEGAILRCLEKDPRDRPSSAAAVAGALSRGSERSWRPAAGLEIPYRPHWTLESKIGGGGFGEVWLAAHTKTGDRHVFKFCYQLDELRTLQREVTLFRFLKEKLGERDDIVRILDWSFEEPPYFVESEHAADGNLLDWAAARGGIGAVALEERLGVVVKVARALAAAHSVGVLHKDVKPTNILIVGAAGGGPGIRLSDFGVGSVTGRGQLLDAGITALGLTERGSGSRPGGTPLYMAPEVLEGKPATVQADVYALGVMLYQMAVGDFSRVLTSSWRRDVEDELLAEDVAAATDGSPERRLASAGELARRLQTLDKRRVERAARKRQRRLARAGSVVMSALVLLIAVLGYHSRRIAREQARTRNLVRVTLAGEWLAKDPTSAALMLLEVDRPESTAFAASRMREALYEELALFELRLHRPLLSAAVSPGGEHVAVLAEDGGAWLWSLDGSFEPLRIGGHDGPIVAVAFHPDGRRMLTGSEDGAALIRDGPTAAAGLLSTCDGPVRAMAFDPSGERAVTTCKNGPVRVFRLAGSKAAGEPVAFTGIQGPPFSASFSPDGRRLLTVSEESVEIWDAGRSDAPLLRFPRRLRQPISSVSFDPDGRNVAVVFGDLNPTVEVWPLDDSGETRVLGRHQGPVSSAVFSPDGGSVLTASEDAARIWRLEGDAAAPAVLSGHRGRVASAVFGPAGERIVTASTDGTARVWQADGGAPAGPTFRVDRVMKSDEALISAALDPAGERLVTVSREGTLRLWSLTRPEVFISLRHEGPVSDASFSPNGRYVLTSSEDGTVRLWNADGSGEPAVLGDLRDVMDVTEASFSSNGDRILAIYEDLTVRTWNADGSGGALFFERHLADGIVTQVALSPEGTRLAAAPRDGEIRIWNVGDPRPAAVLAYHGSRIEDVAFSPGGDLVASAASDGTVRIWNVDGSGEERVLEHDSRVYAVSFGPAGRRLAAASADGKVRVWNLDRLAVATVFRHDRLFRAPLFSHDGDLVVTVSQDGTARLGPADGAGKSFFLKGHTTSVVHAAFSPDGRRIVTASRDGTARVWNADGTGETIVLRHRGPVQTAAFGPGGERVVTASQDGTARVWRLMDTDELVAAIRAATRVCLDPSLRRDILGEPSGEAERRSEACRREHGETGK